jgi:alpha-galactosidase
MIQEEKRTYLLSTATTSLVLRVTDYGKVLCEYYGRKISSFAEIPSLLEKRANNEGCELSMDAQHPSVSSDTLKLELSTAGRGDYRNPSLLLENVKGAVFDFTFVSAEISATPLPLSLLPLPHGATGELIFTLTDKGMGARVRLHYLVYEKDDVIGRYLEVINDGSDLLTLHRACSLQIVLPNRNFESLSLYGGWGNENNIERKDVSHGRYLIESMTGLSSNRHNPLVLLCEKGKGAFDGESYGFNLVYSGNHQESIELDGFDDVCFQSGVSSFLFKKDLTSGASFVTPVAVMTYSPFGRTGVSAHFQDFVNDCVIPPKAKDLIRPVVYNNWEATMFDFDKGTIEGLMNKAEDLGVELFVLDDGWFSTRNDDSHGLGDWNANVTKIHGGLAALATYAKKHHLQFGIWMEPEMVNENSELFHQHPNWIIQDGNHTPMQGRNQFTLDLSQKEVQEYVFAAVSGVLKSADISYLKWDYNRPMSDFPHGNSSFFYDYIVGLYSVLSRLIEAFPDVLFENCASGGNRFDLGMLSYFPQSWLSDDTDSFQRITIQKGALLGYPLSVLSNHVSAKTSNQLLRYTSLDTKFDVACFGDLGYELDLKDLTRLDVKIITEQIAYYKAHRNVFQKGHFTEVASFENSTYEVFQAMLGDEAVIGRFEAIQRPSMPEGRLIGKGFADDALYSYENRRESISPQKFGHLINLVSPIHLKEEGYAIRFLSDRKDLSSEVDKGTVSGAVLNSYGAALSQEWVGTGLNDFTRVQGDFGGRVYALCRV